jgi:hypothetical protein
VVRDAGSAGRLQVGSLLLRTLDDRKELPGTGPGLEVVGDPDCRSVLSARRKSPVGDHPGTARHTRQCAVRAFVHAVNVGALRRRHRLAESHSGPRTTNSCMADHSSPFRCRYAPVCQAVRAAPMMPDALSANIVSSSPDSPRWPGGHDVVGTWKVRVGVVPWPPSTLRVAGSIHAPLRTTPPACSQQ